jgi:hypothetical protein
MRWGQQAGTFRVQVPGDQQLETPNLFEAERKYFENELGISSSVNEKSQKNTCPVFNFKQR